jgi:hypothetical protein
VDVHPAPARSAVCPADSPSPINLAKHPGCTQTSTHTDLEAALAANPANYAAYLDLAEAYQAAGSFERAASLLQSAHYTTVTLDQHFAVRLAEARLMAARGETAASQQLTAEIRAAQSVPGTFGPGAGPTLYVPFVFRRGRGWSLRWFAFAVWAAVLFGKWLFDRGLHLRLLNRFKRSPILTISTGTAAFSLAGFGLYSFWQYFTFHPTHGSNLLGSRSFMWLNAIEIWQSSPWFGAGIGRFAVEYLTVDEIPPAFWAPQGHNLFFHALAETGLAGLLVLLLLVMLGFAWLWRRYQAADSQLKPWSWAILAAMLAFLAAGIPDDHTGYPAVMVPLILLLAWQVTAPPDRLPAHKSGPDRRPVPVRRRLHRRFCRRRLDLPARVSGGSAR